MNTNPTDDKSLCHQAPVIVVGGRGDFNDNDKGITLHYECTECHQPCDLYAPTDDLREQVGRMIVENLNDDGQTITDFRSLRSDVMALINTAVFEARVDELQRTISLMRPVLSGIAFKNTMNTLEDRLVQLTEKEK